MPEIPRSYRNFDSTAIISRVVIACRLIIGRMAKKRSSVALILGVPIAKFLRLGNHASPLGDILIVIMNDICYHYFAAQSVSSRTLRDDLGMWGWRVLV